MSTIEKFNKYYIMHGIIKVFTAFSGYDSQMMALNRVADRHKDEINAYIEDLKNKPINPIVKFFKKLFGIID